MIQFNSFTFDLDLLINQIMNNESEMPMFRYRGFSTSVAK